MRDPNLILLGIDFSGHAAQWGRRKSGSSVWIAELDTSLAPIGGVRDLRTVQQLEGEGLPFERLAQRLQRRDFAVAGIDAPFSLPSSVLGPRTHAELLATVDALRCGPRPFPSGGELIATFLPAHAPNGSKIYRQTDDVWRDRGINVRSTMFWKHRGGAPFTSAAIKLLATVGGDMWPWSKAVKNGLLAEAFPAAQLLVLDLPHVRYSGRAEASRDARRRITEALERQGLDFGDHRNDVLASADALDAVICALAGLGVAEGRLDSDPRDQALSEGWIAVRRAER